MATMKKQLLFTAAITALSFNVFAQKDIEEFRNLKNKDDKNENIDTFATVYNATLTVGLNQGMLHNWAAGGEIISASVTGLFNGYYIKYAGSKIWTNNLDLAYGLLYTYSNKFVPRKVDDRIDLTSKYGIRLNPKKDFYFTTLFNARTQFTEAFNYDVDSWDKYPISNAFSPLYMTLAPGIEYRKGSQVSVFFSPAAMRFTFASRQFTSQNPEGAFGIKQDEIMRFEVGSYLTARYIKEFTPSFSYNGRFDLYANYLAKDVYQGDELVKKNNPGNIDILWDNNFSYKFYKYFSINFGILGVYDNDLPYVRSEDDPTRGLGWWQIKQYLNFGFHYTLK